MTGERLVAGALGISVLASLGLVASYVVGPNPQLEGVLLALSLGGLGIAIVAWSQALMDNRISVEPRHPMPSTASERRAAEEAFAPGDLSRRTFLVRLLAGAVGALGAAVAIPVLSLGPAPGRSLFTTPWRDGIRVVDESGDPIRIGDIALETVRTVFPEGHVGSADAQTLLIRVRPGDLQLAADRAAWAPDGVIGYSKVCTHAGCPVGLYRTADHSLLCPCHQSTFDVLRGALPTFGPAVRALPQLPLGVDGDGNLVARGDFPEPVGPSFWNMTHTDGKS